jgi:hypothetical protein
MQALKDSLNHNTSLIHPGERKNQQHRMAGNFTPALNPLFLLG